MKKSILVMTFIFYAFFQGNAFSQPQEEIDQQAAEKERDGIVINLEKMQFDPLIIEQANQSLIERAQSNEEHIASFVSSGGIVYSDNSNDFNMFKGSVWSFKYTISYTTFEDTLTFDNTVFRSSNGMTSLPFRDQYGRIGVMSYILSGASALSSAAGISQPMYSVFTPGTIINKSYYVKRGDNNYVYGSYSHMTISTYEFSSFYPLTGVKKSLILNDIDNDGDGFTEDQGDCDDNNNTIYPGAIEICGDGIDQDCNGSDLACTPNPYYVDDDGDGYSESQGDCDDNNNTIHPNAIEICGDGIDQDCNGSDLSCSNGPSPPIGVVASDGTLSGKVQLSWIPSPGATSYDVYRADMPAGTGTSPKLIASSVSGNVYNDSSAVSGNQYYYWIKSRNSAGSSIFSKFDTGYWGQRGSIPLVPANVSATDGTFSGKVIITWNATANTLVYEIWRADMPVPYGGTIKNIGVSTTTSYTDSTAVSGKQYYYWVKSRNSWGGSRYSKYDTGYIGVASPVLPAPTGVSATDGTVPGKVKLTWNAVSGAVVYEIYRAAQPVYLGGKPMFLGTLKNNVLFYDDASMTCGNTYYYWVKARNSWGSSKYSTFDSGYCTGP